MPTDFFHFDLFQRALIVGLLASIACGVVGTLVVVRKMSSISGGLSHAAFGGVGMGCFLGFSPVLGALLFCLASAIIIGIVYRTHEQGLDTLIAMLWSLGMAIGMLFIAFTPGYAPDFSSYLFGNILFVPEEMLLWALLLDVAVVAVIALLYKELQAISFDEEFAEVMGLPVGLLFSLLLILTAFAVVVLMRVAGVVLTIALVTTPAVTARQWSKSLPVMMAWSVAITACAVTGGLFFADWLSERTAANVPTGPLIIVLVTVLFGVSALVRSYRRARFGSLIDS